MIPKTFAWIKVSFNLNVEGKENDYLTHCFNENILYTFNRKRGMYEYRDPVSNLFCVTFDNSSIMGQFYKDIANLDKTTITAIYNNYVKKNINSNYYYNQNTGLIQNKNSYAVGDYLRVNLDYGQNRYIFDGKFFLYESGAFGECIKTKAVKYMVPIEKTSCGLKIVFFL